MRAGVALLWVFALIGCQKAAPITVHGKSLDHWIDRVHDADGKTRKKAIEVLGNVGAIDASVVPVLIAALKDREAGVRDAATLALLKIGPAAKDALPALSDACNDRDNAVRAHAAKALERIQGRQ